MPFVIFGFRLAFIAAVVVVGFCRAPAAEWSLVWSDEFAQPDGSAPDSSKWVYDLGANKWGNNELQTYTDRRQNSRIEGGRLIIEARKESYAGADNIRSDYTSARLKTQGRVAWTSGRMEARIKLPRGQGIWPAFWMLGTNISAVDWPTCGEIDIMENIGREPFTIHGTIHGPGYSGSEGIGGAITNQVAVADDFHLFAVDWEPSRIQWFFDGKLYFTVTPTNLPGGKEWVFNRDQFLILNVAVGGGWPGNPDATTSFPQRMEVDYVRVYARTNTPSTAALFQVPAGFMVERVAGPPEIQFPMFATLDDKGRLYVTESSGGDLYGELQKLTRTCRVSMLEDRDGDGRYEIARVFADKLTPSMGVVWREGKLYAADPPDLVTLEDSDGDGHADKRTVVLTGFGHSDNGSLHGLTFGPDGWLYFTTGNPDGYDLRGPDGSRARGGTGALLRCQPDGSRVETVARGFENLVEIVFTPDGSIIGTLNWYQLPDRGVRDALVHILEAGQFPIHPVDNVPHLLFNTVLPPIALFPAVAHSGLEIYRGGNFPPEMRGNLFSAEHNTRKIVRHRLTPKGSSYSVENFDFVTTDDPDVHFSDVLEDADGSLLVVDTGSWYVQHCPTGRIRQAPARGGIYRVSYSRRREEANFKKDSNDHPITSAATTSSLLASLRATNEVTAAAARMLGRRAETNAASELAALLRSPNPALRLAAAEALAHCGGPASVPDLLQCLAADTDEFLEHALTFALYRLANRDALVSALDHPSPKVQRASLLLLDQPPFQAAPENAVVARLNTSDPRLRDTARWVLLRHPEWGDAGAAFLRQLIEVSNPTEADQQALAQFLPLFQTNSTVVSAVARSLAGQTTTDLQRVRLLGALAALDVRDPPAPLAEAIRRQLMDGSAAVRASAIRTAGALHVPGVEEPLAEIARDAAQPETLRTEALRELVHRRPLLEAGLMDFLLAQLVITNTATVRLTAAETLTSANLTATQMVAFLQGVRGDPLISPSTILAAVERHGVHAGYAVALLDYLAASLDAGWTISADQLTKMQAAVPEAQHARADKLLARVAENIARQRQQLAEFEPLLKGGDYVRGEKVFFEKAQCTTCHRVWENGGRVGPDLTSIGSIRSGRDILESLVLPSSTIAQGYETLNVTMKAGESFTGVRVGKSEDPLVLRLASGAEMTLHPSQIERVDRSKLSIMPEGLLNSLTRDEVRDLLGYLQQLK